MSDVKQVRFVVPVVLRGVKYIEGDVKGFPLEDADRYIDAGFAECIKTGERGELVPGARYSATPDKLEQQV